MNGMIKATAFVTMLSLPVILLCSCGVVIGGGTAGGPSGPGYSKDRGPLGIPPGHLPPPGSCRIWHPGKPPGHQPPPGDCASLSRRVPRGAWLLHRPSGDAKHVRVKVFDVERPSVVMVIRHYVAATGKFIREENPGR